MLLGYPDALARISSSALMPQPYGMRGGWRATFAGGVLEYAVSAGFTGQGPACLTGHADNRIDPASALVALELTLDIHQRLTRPAS